MKANYFFKLHTLTILALLWLIAPSTIYAQAPAGPVTAAYGVVLPRASIAYLLLERAILAYNGPHSKLARSEAI